MPTETSQATDDLGALVELEPIFRQTEGSFSFAHQSFQEILTAKRFADEINSVRLSVKDAYEQFWSFQEDKDLWALPRKDWGWRSLLPQWKPILLHIMDRLDDDKAQELVDIVGRWFDLYHLINYDKEVYNPFHDDFHFMHTLAGRNKLTREKLGKEIVDSLLKRYDSERELGWEEMAECLRYREKYSPIGFSSCEDHFVQENVRLLKELKYYGPRLLDLLKTSNIKKLGDAAYIMGEIGYFDPAMLGLLRSLDEEIEKAPRHEVNELITRRSALRYGVALTLARLEHYDPILLEMLEDDSQTVRNVVEHFFEFNKHFDPRTLEYLRHENPEVRRSAASVLANARHFDPAMLDLLQDPDEGVRFSVDLKLNLLDHYGLGIADLWGRLSDDSKEPISFIMNSGRRYHPRFLDLLKHEDYEVRNSARKALMTLKHYDPKMLDLLNEEGATDGSWYARKYIPEIIIRAGHYDPKMLDLLKGKDMWIRNRAADIIIGIGHYDPAMLELLESDDMNLVCCVLQVMGALGHYHPKMDELEKNEDPWVVFMVHKAQYNFEEVVAARAESLKGEVQGDAARVLVGDDYHESLLGLLASNDLNTREAAKMKLIRAGHYDLKMLDLLEHEDDNVVHAMEDVLEEVGQFHPKLVELLYHERQAVREAAVNVLGAVGHYHPKMVEFLTDESKDMRRWAEKALLCAVGSFVREGSSPVSHYVPGKVAKPEIVRDMASRGLLKPEYATIIKSVQEGIKPKGYVAPERLAA